MTHYQRRKTHEKETTKGTADPCRHTAYIFYSSALPFFHSICRNQIHLSCNRRTAERNLELFSGYYGITVDYYYFVRASFLRLCLCVWLTGRCSVRAYRVYPCEMLWKKEKTWISGGMGTQIAESKICTPCVPASFLHDRILF